MTGDISARRGALPIKNQRRLTTLKWLMALNYSRGPARAPLTQSTPARAPWRSLHPKQRPKFLRTDWSVLRYEVGMTIWLEIYRYIRGTRPRNDDVSAIDYYPQLGLGPTNSVETARVTSTILRSHRPRQWPP